MGVNGEASGTSSRVGTFEVVLWGYDRKQVEACMTQLEEQLTALYDEQRQAMQLTGELQRLRAENADLRARLSGVPLVHPVGTRVQQILAIAEEEATELRSSADRYLAAAREDAAAIVAAAKQEAARARRDCELAMTEQRRSQQEAADQLLAAARADADRIRAEAHGTQGNRRRRPARAEHSRTDRARAEHTAPAEHAPAGPTRPSAEGGTEPRRSRAASHDLSRPVPALRDDPA
jgi:cell division septum initiation protein DivIVA